jgi:hypothetical protein
MSLSQIDDLIIRRQVAEPQQAFQPKDLDEKVGEAFSKILNKYTLSIVGAGTLGAVMAASAPVWLSMGAAGGAIAYFSDDIKTKALSFFTKKEAIKTEEIELSIQRAQELLDIHPKLVDDYEHIDSRYREAADRLDESYLKARTDLESEQITAKQDLLQKAYQLLTQHRYSL